MYRVVMVPTDGSDASLHAIPLALAIARPSNAVVHLVTVMEAAVVAPIYGVPIAAGGWTSGALVDPGALTDADALSRQSQQRALHEFSERLAVDAGVSVVPSLVEGDVVESLSRYAETQAVDVVVLTTHGRGGIGRALFGSVTDSLVRRVSCPMLVARPHGTLSTPYAPATISHVLVALDGSPESDRVLPHAAAVAEVTGARCTLLHLRHPEILSGIAAPETLLDPGSERRDEDDERAHLDRHASLFRERGIDVSMAVLRAKDVKSSLMEYAGTHAVDLVAMATHARHGLERMMLGSTATALLHETRLPMLLFRSTSP
jgi:nucleotide-binding universal stress UspA family protein